MHKQRSLSFSLLLLFLVFLLLAFLFPYSGDDWDWGTQGGLDRLYVLFEHYNGRYLGNFLVLLLTRCKPLNMLAMAASYTFACWSCLQYSRSRRLSSLLLAGLLFFIMPKSIFSQSIVWTSGFVNYVPSILISIGYLLLSQNYFLNESIPDPSGSSLFLTFLMGFSGALFIENITLFNICLGFAVMGYTWLKFQRLDRSQTGFLIGAIAGAVLLFSNSAYRSVANGADDYRKIAHTGYEIIITVVQHANELLDYLIYENLLFCVILSLLLSILVLNYMKASSALHKTLSAVILSVHLLCLVFIAFIHYRPTAMHDIPCSLGLFPFLMDFLLAMIALLYVFCLWAGVILCIPRKKSFYLLIPLYCIPVAIAPFLLVNPIGPRCVFAGYLLLMMFTVALFDYVRTLPFSFLQYWKIVFVGLLAVTFLQIVCLYSTFLSIHTWDIRRSEYIKLQSDHGSSTIYLCALPHEEYLHNSSPDKYYLVDFFKLYHELDPSCELYFLPREELELMMNNTYTKESLIP